MCDRKSQASEKAYSMTHGKPSGDRCLQPCMFEILSWADPQAPCQHPHSSQVEECPIAQSMVIQVPRAVVAEQYEPQRNTCSAHQHQNGEINVSRIEDPREIKIEQKLAAEENSYKQSLTISNDNLGKKKTLKPHEVKKELYMYDNIHLKATQEEKKTSKSPQQREKTFSRPSPKKLNAEDEQDREIIKRREEKIKYFKLTSRDLPNSAFTTYFGKPAFESYGRCNSQANINMKSHNVMPHRGENRPNYEETYASALMKGKKIKNSVHIPLKPVEGLMPEKKINTETSQIVNLPLQKPDLINHVRFSDQKGYQTKNVPVPKASTNQAKKQLNKKYTFMSNSTSKKGKKAKNKKGNTVYNDGLKYLNTRENLLSLLEQKKMKQSKLAYKVTQCYPEGWPHEQEHEHEEGGEGEPAGIKYIRSDSAKHLIYRYA